MKDGKMSKESAQKAAKDAVRMSRYGGKDGKTEYFYIPTESGIIIRPFIVFHTDTTY
mgnify:CR=1 FL=1